MDVYVSLFCACVVLCAGSGLATGSSPAQVVLTTAYKDQETAKAVKVQQMAVEPKMDGWMDGWIGR
jgi:hypothetical protein